MHGPSAVNWLELIMVCRITNLSSRCSLFFICVLFFHHIVAEPLYGLGVPQKQYASRTFNCSIHMIMDYIAVCTHPSLIQSVIMHMEHM